MSSGTKGQHKNNRKKPCRAAKLSHLAHCGHRHHSARYLHAVFPTCLSSQFPYSSANGFIRMLARTESSVLLSRYHTVSIRCACARIMTLNTDPGVLGGVQTCQQKGIRVSSMFLSVPLPLQTVRNARIRLANLRASRLDASPWRPGDVSTWLKLHILQDDGFASAGQKMQKEH